MTRLLLLCFIYSVVVTLVVLAAPAYPSVIDAPRRLVLVITSHPGATLRDRLRYTGRDAARFARQLGGNVDLTLLSDPSPRDLDRTFAELTKKPVELLVRASDIVEHDLHRRIRALPAEVQVTLLRD
ncbi:MAG: hypothetical protein ABI867_28060 [Kofleriaceae bacterium]